MGQKIITDDKLKEALNKIPHIKEQYEKLTLEDQPNNNNKVTSMKTIRLFEPNENKPAPEFYNGDNVDIELDKYSEQMASIVCDALNSVKNSPKVSLNDCRRVMLHYPNFSSFATDGLLGFGKIANLSKMQKLYIRLLDHFLRKKTGCIDYSRMHIKSRIEFSKFLIDLYRGVDNEVLHLFYVDEEMQILSHHEYSGTTTNIAVGIDDIIIHRPYSRYCGLFIVHNHPNGAPFHSIQDRKFLGLAQKKAALFHIELLDFIIVTQKTVYSMFTGKTYVSGYREEV